MLLSFLFALSLHCVVAGGRHSRPAQQTGIMFEDHMKTNSGGREETRSDSRATYYIPSRLTPRVHPSWLSGMHPPPRRRPARKNGPQIVVHALANTTIDMTYISHGRRSEVGRNKYKVFARHAIFQAVSCEGTENRGVSAAISIPVPRSHIPSHPQTASSYTTTINRDEYRGGRPWNTLLCFVIIIYTF